MKPLIRIPKAAPTLRQQVKGSFGGPSMSDFSPFDSEVDKGFSIVRGMDAIDYKRDGEAIRREGFEKNSIVNACARIIADQIAGARMESYSITARGEVVLHPKDDLQALLDTPAPQMSGFRFRRAIGLHLALYGNAYVVITQRTNGLPSRLRVVHPERMMHIVVDPESDEILAYQWQTNDGKPKVSLWTDVVHIKDELVDPDMYFGFPRALASLLSMVTDGEASAYVRQVLHNSGVPALVMFGRQGIGQDELRRAESAWHERMVERGERGRTRFLAGIEALQVIGHSLKDLEFPSLRQISREDICAAFGVDARMVGASSAKGQEGGLSGSQYQEARRRLEQQTCTPLRIEIQEAMDLSITPEFGERWARFSPSAIAAIIETPTEIAQRMAVLVASRVATLEEARQEIGLPEQMDPTHTTEATALQTIQEALEANEREAQAAEKALAAKTTGDVAKGATVSEQVDGPDGITDANNNTERQASAGAPAHRAAAPSRIRTNGSADLTPDEEEAAWRAFDARARALEPELRQMADEALEDAVTQVLRALDRAEVRAEDPQWWEQFTGQILALFGASGVIRGIFERRFRRRLTEMMERAGDRLIEELRSTVNTDSPRFQAGVRKRLETLARSLTKTVGERMLDVISLGRASGFSRKQMAEFIRLMRFDTIAQRVAETESVGLINHAEMLVAEESGVLRKKRWLSQRDDRVRDSHRACDAKGWIDIEASFPNGLRFAHDPNGSADEVVNCRCSTMYSDQEANP